MHRERNGWGDVMTIEEACYVASTAAYCVQHGAVSFLCIRLGLWIGRDVVCRRCLRRRFILGGSDFGEVGDTKEDRS